MLIIKSTFIPTLIMDKAYFAIIDGILGNTISPYLFFFQTSMEVEEVKQRKLIVDKRKAKPLAGKKALIKIS